MKSGKKKEFNYINVLQILTLVALLLYMQIAVSKGIISKVFLASPSDIVKEGIKIITDGTLLPHFLVSVEEILVGYGIAAVAGIGVGILWTLFPKLEEYLNVFCAAIMAIPKVAILPLLVLWFGIGFVSKVVLIFLFSFFTILYKSIKNRVNQINNEINNKI